MDVEKYGFTTISLSVAGFKDDPWILANNIIQVFYIPDPLNRKKEIVLPGKQRIVGVENVTDAKAYNQFNEIPPFRDPEKLKRLEATLNKTMMPYLRTDIKGKVVQAGKQ